MSILSKLLSGVKDRGKECGVGDATSYKVHHVEGYTSKTSLNENNGILIYRREAMDEAVKCPKCNSSLVRKVYIVEGPYFSKNGECISVLIKVFAKYECKECDYAESKKVMYIPLHGVEALLPFLTDEFKNVIEQIKIKAEDYKSILRRVLI